MCWNSARTLAVSELNRSNDEYRPGHGNCKDEEESIFRKVQISGKCIHHAFFSQKRNKRLFDDA
jgi:hypothetical protein